MGTPGMKLRRLRLLRLIAELVLLACCGCIHSAGAWAQTTSTSFAVLSQKAAEARDADRLEEASVLYAKALALRPKWDEGWWALGTLEYDQDHYARAAKAFEKLLALKPSNGTAHAMLGLCQFELGKDEPALKNLLAAEKRGVVKDAQLRQVGLYHLGLLQLRTRKFSAARETLTQLAGEKVKTKELTIALGQAALLIRPQDSPPEGTAGAEIVERAGEAEILMAAKEFDRAKEIYAETAKEYPDYPHLHFAFGRCLLDTHDADEAVEEFQRELQRDPKDVNSMLEIAAVRYKTDSKDGLKYAEEAAKLAPQLPFAHYILGLLRLDTGDAAAAIPELEIANKVFPSEASVYFSLGAAYARVGRNAEAAKARAEFVRLNAKAEKQSGATTYGAEPHGFPHAVSSDEEKMKPRP
jgi:tetratricopeptide (TPR) repeat protein